MRRKKGTLIPIERDILEAATKLHNQGVEEFHGFQIAKELGSREGARRLTGLGTLYRALCRLEKQGLLNSRWEEYAPEQHRPRRRYYRLAEQKKPQNLSTGLHDALDSET